jgi:hypothetical protein
LDYDKTDQNRQSESGQLQKTDKEFQPADSRKIVFITLFRNDILEDDF